MTLRVEFTEAAAEQVGAAAAWWRTNRRAASELFDEELAYAIRLLARMPTTARVWRQIEGKDVRKARLPRTRYTLFFTVDEDIVTVHAVWHAARGSLPPLG